MLHPLLSHSNALGVSDPETHTRWGLGEWSPQAYNNGSPQEHSPTHYGSGPPRPHAACRATALHRPTPSSHTFILSPELFQHPSITYTPPYLSQPAPGLEPLANRSTRLKLLAPPSGPPPPPAWSPGKPGAADQAGAAVGALGMLAGAGRAGLRAASRKPSPRGGCGRERAMGRGGGRTLYGDSCHARPCPARN